MGDSGNAGLLPAEWVRIVERATTLHERLDAHRTGPSRPHADLQDDAAASAWRESAASGDPAKFRRRLQALALHPTDLPHCLDAPDLSGIPLPQWCQLLVRAADLARAGDVGSLLPAGVVDPAPEALPDLLGPLVAVAVFDLIARCPELSDPRALPLLGDLAGHLQRKLADTVQACVDAALRKARRAEGRPDGNLWTGWMQEQAADGLTGLWTSFPALARLVGTTLQLWVERSAELLDRAATDLPMLNDCFAARWVRLARVNPGLSDSHNGHATVVDCQFSDDQGRITHVIYKPKDVSAERAFGDVCRWMREHGLDLGAAPTVVPRAGYGWVQSITGSPAADAGQVDRFYRRCGMLAVVLFVLGATDCTAENVVARGDGPVVIDAETILAPAMQQQGQATDGHESILDALFLPRWLRIGDRAVDLSALGTADPEQQPRVSHSRWVGAGTTDARLEPVAEFGLRRRSDLVDHEGTVQSAIRHTPEVLAGFDQAWSMLARNADSLTGPDGPLSALAGAPVRVLVRMTGMYQRVLRQSLAPELLSDGLDRSLHLERLARYPLNRPDGAVALALADAEREQMEIADVPVFTVSGEQHSLTNADDTPLLMFGESALGRARRRSTCMTPRERDRQRDHLRASLAVSPPRVRVWATSAVPTTPPRPTPSSDHSEDIRVAACRVLLDRIAAGTEPVTGGYRLVGLTAVSREQWGIAPLDAMFFDGTAGVATALFAAARTLGDLDVEEMAVAVLRPGLLESLARLDRIIQVHGLGVPSGAGGLLYGWSQCLELATTSAARALLEAGLAELAARLDGYLPMPGEPARPPARCLAGELPDRAATGDSLGCGSAGWIEFLRLDRIEGEGVGRIEKVDHAHDDGIGAAASADSPMPYDVAVRELAGRVVADQLRLGVPQESPLPAYGLHDGIAGVLFALSAAAPGADLPSLLTWRACSPGD